MQQGAATGVRFNLQVLAAPYKTQLGVAARAVLESEEARNQPRRHQLLAERAAAAAAASASIGSSGALLEVHARVLAHQAAQEQHALLRAQDALRR